MQKKNYRNDKFTSLRYQAQLNEGLNVFDSYLPVNIIKMII